MEVNWSMIPHGTPAKSCSACWHSNAFSDRVERLARHRFEQGGGGNLQRGAAGQPAAVRQGGLDDRVEAADSSSHASWNPAMTPRT